MNNTKNYHEQGGEKWVIGGTIEVTADGQILIEGIQLTRANAQADSVAATVAGLKDDFNALLTKLKVAGLMATE